MPRSVDEDFKLLVEFISNYSLSSVIKDSDYIKDLKLGHKDSLFCFHFGLL